MFHTIFENSSYKIEICVLKTSAKNYSALVNITGCSIESKYIAAVKKILYIHFQPFHG